jgi:hypothetical protein
MRILGIVALCVYYSDYGNLDSEICLRHVVDNLQRKALGAREEAEARTLRPVISGSKRGYSEILLAAYRKTK